MKFRRKRAETPPPGEVTPEPISETAVTTLLEDFRKALPRGWKLYPFIDTITTPLVALSIPLIVAGIGGVIAESLATGSSAALRHAVFRFAGSVSIAGVILFVGALYLARKRKMASSLGGALLVHGSLLMRHASIEPMASNLIEAVESWEKLVYDWLQTESVELGPYFRMGPLLSEVHALHEWRKREFVVGFLERRIEQLGAITLKLY